MIVIALNPTNEAHLAEVIEKMKTHGAPSIRAVWNGSEYLSLEGSHRLAASAELGIFPEIVELSSSDEMPSDILEECCMTAETVDDFLCQIGMHQGAVYDF